MLKGKAAEAPAKKKNERRFVVPVRLSSSRVKWPVFVVSDPRGSLAAVVVVHLQISVKEKERDIMRHRILVAVSL